MIAEDLFLASRPNLPASEYLRLAENRYTQVRLELAKNPTIPEQVVSLLLGDRQRLVIDRVLDNPNITPVVLQQALNNTTAPHWDYLWWQVARNRRCRSVFIEACLLQSPNFSDIEEFDEFTMEVLVTCSFPEPDWV